VGTATLGKLSLLVAHAACAKATTAKQRRVIVQ
jgi:hypothetical protein